MFETALNVVDRVIHRVREPRRSLRLVFSEGDRDNTEHSDAAFMEPTGYENSMVSQRIHLNGNMVK